MLTMRLSPPHPVPKGPTMVKRSAAKKKNDQLVKLLETVKTYVASCGGMTNAVKQLERLADLNQRTKLLTPGKKSHGPRRNGKGNSSDV